MEAQKAAEDLKSDIKGYFKERDKSNRGNNGLINDLQEKASAEAEVKDLLYKASMKEVELPEGTEPMFNTIFLTARRNKVRTENGLIIATALSDGGVDLEYQEVQKVMAHGPQVQQAWRGSEVCLDFESLRVRLDENLGQKVNKESVIKIPIININGNDYIRVSERNLKYIVKKETKYKPEDGS